MKAFLFTVVAVFAGIAVYAKLSMRKKALSGTVNQDNAGNVIFAGPDVDPISGAHLAPGARPGTVNAPSTRY